MEGIREQPLARIGGAMRKKCRRKVFALVNPIIHALEGARITSGPLLDKLRLLELSAIESFAKGQATRKDWTALAELLNLAETMAQDGIGPEVIPVCQQAQEALIRAFDRAAGGKSLGMDGPGLNAIRDLYALHDAQRTAVSRSEYEKAIKKTADRVKSRTPQLTVVGAA